MAKGARFGNDFLMQQAAKRNKWNKRGVKAGHGGSFSTEFMNPYGGSPGQKGKRPSRKGAGDDYFSRSSGGGYFSPESAIKTAGLPDWLVDIIKSDPEIKRAMIDKGFTPDSPHKEALVAVAKDITLLVGRPATEDSKAKKGSPEHYIQVRIFYWLERDYPEYYRLIKGVPNGGLRHKSTAFQMKAEGQKAGTPDIDVDIPKGRYHGMRLEVKTESGSLQANQKEQIALLNERGYYAVVGKGFEECWRLIMNYLALPDFDNMTCISEN